MHEALSRPPSDPVLIISAFDRVSAPSSVNEPGFAGFTGFLDEGVPHGRDPSFVGDQYEYDTSAPFLSNESPGHGASFSDFETRVLTGNTFDYPGIHGAAILASGRAFATVSDEVFSAVGFDSRPYSTLDLILGEEKTTHGPGPRIEFEAIPPALQTALRRFSDDGGAIMASGAYVATDLAGPGSSDEDKTFATEVLGLVWRADHASRTGKVDILEGVLRDSPPTFTYNTDATHPWMYRVESPDALGAAEISEVLMRYAENRFTAAIGRPGGAVVLGFPFETILSETDRNRLMASFLDYLDPAR